MAAPDPELHDGDVFAGHRIDGVAGRGGMGVVYRALQLDLERPVALKLIVGSLAADEDFRARFVREARAAAAIDHPNVIPVYSAGEQDGRLYLAMRFVDGEDLRSLVRRGGPLEADRAARIIAQVGAALDAAHARGLVHRDVKPANVLLDGDHAYLTDFGLTKRLEGGETTVTGAGRWVGTLGYVAPEQIRGEPVDARADVYALGCLLFYGLTGTAPYRRDSDEATLYAHLHEPAPDARDLAPDVPGPLADVVRRALEKDPADRFPSAGDLGRAALAAVGDAPGPPPERTVARGAAAPGGGEETAVSPSDTPTELAITRVIGRRVRPWLAPALSLLAGAAVVVVAALLLTGSNGDDTRPTTSTATTTAAAIGPGDLRTGRPMKVDPRPTSIAFARGRLWVTSARRNRLTGVPADGRGATRHINLPFSGGATSVAAGFGSLWVTNGNRSQLVRLALPSGKVEKVIDLPDGDAVLVATGEGAVWVGRREGHSGSAATVIKIDERTNAIAAKVLVGEEGVAGLTTGGGYVWLTNGKRSRITRIRPSDGVRKSLPIGAGPRGVAYGGGTVWVAQYDDYTLAKLPRGIDNKTVKQTVAAPVGVAYSGAGVWVAGYLADAVALHDPRTGGELARVDVGSNPFAIAARGDRAWVTNLADGTVTPISVDTVPARP